jgi:hypothetical protein
LADQPVGVLVAGSLPRAARVAQEHRPPVAAVSRACSAISLPWSQVNQRPSCSGSRPMAVVSADLLPLHRRERADRALWWGLLHPGRSATQRPAPRATLAHPAGHQPQRLTLSPPPPELVLLLDRQSPGSHPPPPPPTQLSVRKRCNHPLTPPPGDGPDEQHRHGDSGKQDADQHAAAQGSWWILWLQAPTVGGHAHRRIVPYSPATAYVTRLPKSQRCDQPPSADRARRDPGRLADPVDSARRHRDPGGCSCRRRRGAHRRVVAPGDVERWGWR